MWNSSYIAFYLMLMLAPSWFFLIPAYLVFAIAYIGDPALGSLYADSLDEETRAEALSLDSTLSGIASLFMPPVGGFLITYLGGIGNPDALRAFYGFYVIFHTLTMIYFWRRLQDDGPAEKEKGALEALGSLKVVFADGRIRRYLVLTMISSLTAGLSAPFVTIYIFAELGASPTFIGSMVSLSTGITYLALNLGAWLSDRVGRKALVVASYLLSASTLTALALADSTTALMPYYILAALTAIGGAASGALMFEYVPSDLRSRYLGANEALSLLCVSAGPTLGGLVYAHLGPKTLFQVQAALQCFIIAPYFLLAIPETRKPKTRTPAHLQRRPRLPSWLTLNPRTHH